LLTGHCAIKLYFADKQAYAPETGLPPTGAPRWCKQHRRHVSLRKIAGSDPIRRSKSKSGFILETPTTEEIAKWERSPTS
jgi:hypothetical protein